MAAQSKSQLTKILVALEGLSSLFGFVGGIPLTLDPSGKLLGLPLSYLTSFPLPLHDFLLPGIWLLFGYGFGLAFAGFLLWKGSRSGWYLSVVIGLVWLGWVSFQSRLRWAPTRRGHLAGASGPGPDPTRQFCS